MTKPKIAPHRGPAPTGVPILVRIEPDTLARVDLLARKAGLSRAAQIRLMLRRRAA